MAYYIFEIDYAEKGKVLSRKKSFQATNDDTAKVIGTAKWNGAGVVRRKARLKKKDRETGEKIIANWVQHPR